MIMRKASYLTVVIIMCLAFAVNAAAQKKAKVGRVCGDPTADCKGGDAFQAYDLAFDTGKNFVIAESEWFYGIVLKSIKLPGFGDCEHPAFSNEERLAVQELFPRHKVFALNCYDPGTNYYNGVAQKTAFIGVFAGRTTADANAFLKTVQATKRFPGVRVRRMQAGINGT
jgi:hypothetical protein